MKALIFCLVLTAGSLIAGDGVRLASDALPRTIPRDVVLGIQTKAMTDYPNQPQQQVEAVTEGIEAYFALRRVRSNPDKTQAAELYPFNYPKQLYLAIRGA
jgi:hypothetical protein